MVVQFDRNRPFEVSAVGYPPSETQSGSMVQFRVGRSEAGIRFGNEIVNGNLMRIAFAAPDVPVLAVPLRGSAVALTQMRECLVRRGAFQFMGPARRTDPTVQALPDPTAPAISAASGRRT
ncbi:hypothetical protein AAFN86_19655 [Roseomonas sp. CAU 1739]|uniref:hypothetical protein n=1 Tax=Roseomonas sp. CAU 1739 TaxID=3140364 RepID=UPI00325BBF93